MNTIKSLFRLIIKPGSTRELLINTLFLRLKSYWLIVDFHIIFAKITYLLWKLFEPFIAKRMTMNLSNNVKLTFIIPDEQNKAKQCAKTIRAILSNFSGSIAQIIVLSEMHNKEIKRVLHIYEDKQPSIISIYKKKDLFEALQLIEGQFFICCYPGDTFSRRLNSWIQGTIACKPDVDLIYTDVEIKTSNHMFSRPLFKPAILSPELLLSINYLSRSIIKTSTARRFSSQISPKLSLSSQEQELEFLIIEHPSRLEHIPLALLNIDNRFSDCEDKLIVIERHLDRLGYNNPQITQTENCIRVNWQHKAPLVSVIIPTRDNYEIIHGLLESIQMLTDYPDYEVLLVDNGSIEQDVLDYYTYLEREKLARVIIDKKTFNYSQAINQGVSYSRGELLLFLNNDMKVTSKEWLNELAKWAISPEVGVVGAKLVYPNNRIQHAGVIIGLQGLAGHLYLNAPNHFWGMAGSVDWYKNYCAVTGACQMIRRNVFEEVGGYDEGYRLAFSDIDFCLRVLKRGYRNVYDPNVTLIHFEGYSRGIKVPFTDLVHAYEGLKEWLLVEDPFFSPNLTYTPFPNYRFKQLKNRLRIIEERIKAISEANDCI